MPRITEVSTTEEETVEVKEDENPQEPVFEWDEGPKLPPEVEAMIPQWKSAYPKVFRIELSDMIYIYRPLLWKELKEISRKLQTFSNSPNATEASLTMLELELVLERTVLYPKIAAGAVENIPAGDLETLQRLVNEASGWTQLPPMPEEL